MMEAVLDRLIAAETQLIAAFDAGDIEAIEAALPNLAASAAALKPTAWADIPAEMRPQIVARVRSALDIADSARMKARLLADRNQQRMDVLAAAAGRFDCTPATYARG